MGKVLNSNSGRGHGRVKDFAILAITVAAL
jgi:hypothetical protein